MSDGLFRELAETELDLEKAARELREFSGSDISLGAKFLRSRVVKLEARKREINSKLSSLQSPPPEVSQAPVSDPGGGTSKPSAPPGEITPEVAKPPTSKKRRGRTAGVNKINQALTELSSRLKDGLSTTIPAIARAVGCTRDNLKKNKRFMRDYRELTSAMVRVHKHEGSKTGGNLEAWIDPREDRDEDEEGDF